MLKSQVALAGKILPSLSQFVLTPEKATTIAAALRETIDVGDIVLIAVFGWAPVPAAKMIHKFVAGNKVEPKKFEQTYLYLAAEIFSQIVRVGLLILMADIVQVSLVALDVEFARNIDLGYITARVGYTFWTAFKIANFKHYLISQAVFNKSDKLGKAAVINRFINLGICLVAVLFLTDLLDMDMGSGLTSIFALGGVGTLVVSLASKDLAEQFLSGIFLQVSDKFYEGDLVRLGDGTGGVVFKIGWMHTLIRASDDTKLRIPNSQLAGLRVTNLSRVDQCQMKITLYFNYSEMQKMPALAKELKKEIQDSCPHLVIDGSRPFRVHWTDITHDRLEIICDTHHNLKPYGDVYCDNRQQVLEAISSAITKNGIQLAVPAYDIPNLKK